MPAEENSPDRMCITSVTPTICRLMGVPPPQGSTMDAFPQVINAAGEAGIKRIDRCLVFAPDAIGSSLVLDCETSFKEVVRHAPVHVPLRTVYPPKTPVCFASMFTGVMPVWHGKVGYDKWVLRCDTIFDAFIRESKACAIVAVRDSSIDLIFRERDIDYCSEIYDGQVTDRTLELMEEDRHELIVAYHQQYDDLLHETGTRSEEALEALENHIRSFIDMARWAESYWKRHNWLIAFAPDHGAHTHPYDRLGTHGENIPEDMEIDHFYGFGHRIY